MNTGYITFRSVTFAQRGEAALRRGGIRCVLQRTPRWMEEQGCGYCLRVQEHEVRAAMLLLRENEIPYRRGYRALPDGKMEEII